MVKIFILTSVFSDQFATPSLDHCSVFFCGDVCCCHCNCFDQHSFGKCCNL